MDDTQFRLMMKQLDLLTRLAGIGAIRGLEIKEQVRLLEWAGLRPKEIAEVVNKTPNAVRIMLSELRKKKTSQ